MNNTKKGILFELKVKRLLEEKYNCDLLEQEVIKIGFSTLKEHKYDFINSEMVVECKDYSWTKGNNIPSAKISHLREVMLYFSVTSNRYRKLLVLNRSIRTSNNESLGEYFIRLNNAFIPRNIEIWEINENKLVKIY